MFNGLDVVRLAALLQKCTAIGVSGQLVSWIDRFLISRVKSAACCGATSSVREVASGVSHGSVLDNILPLVYINHVAASLSCRYKCFADDYKLYN